MACGYRAYCRLRPLRSRQGSIGTDEADGGGAQEPESELGLSGVVAERE